MGVRAQVVENGSVHRLTLDAGKGNVIDRRVVDEIAEAWSSAVADARTAAVLIEGSGGHFSFGASVEEHRPEEVAAMLGRLHGLIFRLLNSPVPLLFAIRGQCLGGGLELALTGTRIFTHPSAKLGQPEVNLGVFAPAASAILPFRVGQAHADEILLSGRSLSAAEALAIGLVDDVCEADEDPAERALAWVRGALLTKSRSSLRFAVRAARRSFASEVSARITALERLYLEELMATEDAREGIQAFLEKRPPRWQRSWLA